MAIHITRGNADKVIDGIVEALNDYQTDHPGATIDVYRQNSVSVRIRIVDPAFAGQSRVERNQTAWRYLENLAEDVQADISTILLLTPEETKMSFANLEFDDPVPSNL